MKDDKSLNYMSLPDYDIMQYYLIKFRKENLVKDKHIFWRLFIFLLKNIHPILSIFNIYDPIYNRKIRTLDFFLVIYLTFFFTLLPFNITDNSELIKLEMKRSIKNRRKSVNDLEVQINQVNNFFLMIKILQSVAYSIFASVATIIIDSIVKLFFYENILLKEAENKKIAMTKIMHVEHPFIEKKYKMKLRKAFSILKSNIIIQSKIQLVINNVNFLIK